MWSGTLSAKVINTLPKNSHTLFLVEALAFLFLAKGKVSQEKPGIHMDWQNKAVVVVDTKTMFSNCIRYEKLTTHSH